MNRLLIVGHRALLATALILLFALSAGAEKPPPSIDDLDGRRFTIQIKGTLYDLAGNKRKYGAECQTTFVKTGPSTVSLSCVFGGMIGQAIYKDGFLMQAYASGEFPPEDGTTFWARVKGKPGKLKMQGGLTVFGAGPAPNALEILKVKGKEDL
jgi:hypothetical protein